LAAISATSCFGFRNKAASPHWFTTAKKSGSPAPSASPRCDLLEKEGRIGSGLTPYGLRHTLAVILREAGCDERTIADALGQRTVEMARHYAKGADLKGKMRGVVKSFYAELAKRRSRRGMRRDKNKNDPEVVNPADEKCQPFL
jgi:integrase